MKPNHSNSDNLKEQISEILETQQRFTRECTPLPETSKEIFMHEVNMMAEQLWTDTQRLLEGTDNE